MELWSFVIEFSSSLGGPAPTRPLRLRAGPFVAAALTSSVQPVCPLDATPCKRGRPGKVGLAEGAGGVGLPFPKGRKRPPWRDATQQRRDHGKEGLESVTIHLYESETTLTVKTAIYNDTNVESRIPRKRVLIATHL